MRVLSVDTTVNDICTPRNIVIFFINFKTYTCATIASSNALNRPYLRSRLFCSLMLFTLIFVRPLKGYRILN